MTSETIVTVKVAADKPVRKKKASDSLLLSVDKKQVNG